MSSELLGSRGSVTCVSESPGNSTLLITKLFSRPGQSGLDNLDSRKANGLNQCHNWILGCLKRNSGYSFIWGHQEPGERHATDPLRALRRRQPCQWHSFIHFSLIIHSLLLSSCAHWPTLQYDTMYQALHFCVILKQPTINRNAKYWRQGMVEVWGEEATGRLQGGGDMNPAP